MNTREKFKRRVIELIHGLPYEEAEKYDFGNITIGRVMQAMLSKAGKPVPYWWEDNHFGDLFSFWNLTKEDGSECTDDDQTDETIEKIYNLIK